jgi:sentrin-specific protease 1
MAQLLDERNADPSKHGKYNFENVKSWFKAAPGKDIFDLGNILIPVNHGFMHWMCAMIDIAGKRIYMYDSMGDDGMNYLQSLYLQDKHLVERDVELPDIDEWELFGHQPGMPTQQNGERIITLVFLSMVLIG